MAAVAVAVRNKRKRHALQRDLELQQDAISRVGSDHGGSVNGIAAAGLLLPPKPEPLLPIFDSTSQQLKFRPQLNKVFLFFPLQ